MQDVERNYNNLVTVVKVNIDAKVMSEPNVVWKKGNIQTLEFRIETKRLSGEVDEYYVNYPSTLDANITVGDFVNIRGDIRTVKNMLETLGYYGCIFAHDIVKLCNEPKVYQNEARLHNAVIQKVIDFRRSVKLDKDLCVYTLRLYRGRGRYSSCRATSWGSDAVFVHDSAVEGLRADLCARVESYRKSDGSLILGLSVYKLEILPDKEDTDA